MYVSFYSLKQIIPMNNKTEWFLITKKNIPVWKMVWVKSIFSREDLEALTKEELIDLAWLLINNFNSNILK